MSLVSTSCALISSTRIPLLSEDWPFLSLLITLCKSSVVISDISSVFTHFVLEVISFVVVVVSFVEFSEGFDNPFWDMIYSPLSYFIFVMSSTLFFTLLIPGIFRTLFELFKDSLDVLLSLHLFFLRCIFLCVYSDPSVVVSLLWVCFSSPRWVSGFQHLCQGILHSLLLLQMYSSVLVCCRSGTRSYYCWNETR